MAFALPEIEPKYYTYIGFVFALLGMALIVVSILAILNMYGLGDVVPWPATAGGAVLMMLIATLSFHKMGVKKVAL